MYIIVYFFLFYNQWDIIRTGETMRSIKETTTNTIIIKKSEFITTLIPCNDEKEIKDLIELYSKDDATHNCVAYRVGPLEKADDDGEPSGTAGLPMLNVLQRQKIDNVIAIVTRYFGGIKLGAGGLTRAYTNSVADALKEAEIVEKELVKLYRISVDYHFSRKVSYLIQSKNLLLMNTEYDEEVHYDVYLRDTSFLDELNELTASNMHYEVIKMSSIEILLIGIGLSMDAFAVSVCKGLSVKKLSIKNVLLCGVWFGGFQALMPFIGYCLGSTLSGLVDSIDHWIAFILLAFIGINMIKESFEEEKQNDDFSWKTMLMLAIATAIDALAVGVTFSFESINIFMAISIIGLTTFIIASAGVYIGHVFGNKYEQKAQITGGIILILIGIKILIEGLGII